jgi:hypothetical protein
MLIAYSLLKGYARGGPQIKTEKYGLRGRI